jgi:hypothetical protein
MVVRLDVIDRRSAIRRSEARFLFFSSSATVAWKDVGKEEIRVV